MSAIKFELDASLREDLGRGASRRLRQADKIPAILYGAGQDAVALTLDHNKTMQALSHEAFYSHILTLNIGKNKEKVILKALQRHPARPKITHIDFLRVRADQKLQMKVPLHFKGEEASPGFKTGGIFSHIMSDVEVSCLPGSLPEFIEVDVSNLALNETLHLSQLVLPKGVELVALQQEDHDLPVASVHIPRVVEEPTEAPVATEVPSEQGGVVEEGKSESKE